VRQHVVSIFPVNVDPTEDDARTVGWRFTCSCRPWRGRTVTWSDRESAERLGNRHMENVGALAAVDARQRPQETHRAPIGQQANTESGGAV
jgi:hypothetical protein